jgi:hypothetical protein
MSKLMPLLKSSAGVAHFLRKEVDGSLHVDSFYDSEEILEQNKRLATLNDGYSPSRELRRVASIPLALVYLWLNEEGWNALNPAHADKLKAKLNDPSYLYLRTAPGRV